MRLLSFHLSFTTFSSLEGSKSIRTRCCQYAQKRQSGEFSEKILPSLKSKHYITVVHQIVLNYEHGFECTLFCDSAQLSFAFGGGGEGGRCKSRTVAPESRVRFPSVVRFRLQKHVGLG